MTAVTLPVDRGRDGNPNPTKTAYPDIPNTDLLSRIPTNAITILDVGCGTGALGGAYRGVNPKARLLGIECDPDAADVARQRLDVVACVDVERDPLPFDTPDGVDCLIYGDILQQLRDPAAVLRRQLETLRPNGTVLICIPNAEHWSLTSRLLRGTWSYEPTGLLDSHHLRWFSLRTVTRMLTDAGLTIEEVHPRIFAAEQLRQFLGALTSGLDCLGIDPHEYAQRAAPLQYVVRARWVMSEASNAAPAALVNEVPSPRNEIAPQRRVTRRDLSPLIESADAEQWSAAGLQTVDVFANAGRYSRRAAQILSLRDDVRAYHQQRYDARVQEYPAIHRAVFSGAMVTGQGTLILKDSSLISDSCWEVFAQHGIPQGLHHLPDGDLVQSIPLSRRIDTPSLLLKRPYWRNYGHWLVDSAALLALIPALAMPSGWQIVLGLPEDDKMRAIVRETLAALAPDVPVIEHRDNETWEFAELHYVMPLSRTPLFKLPPGLAALRSLILTSSEPRRHGRKIFIDRGPEWRRTLENEAELRSICENAGFEFVKPEQLSLKGQAELFNSAEIIVGIKGAALTNLLFCTSSASAVVLSSDNWGDLFFWDIAGQVGVKYLEILGPTRDASNGPRTSSFRIDPGLFAEALAAASGLNRITTVATATSLSAPDATAAEGSETAPEAGDGTPPPPIVRADTRFTSRPVSALTTTVSVRHLRDVRDSRAILAPAGTIEMPPCYVMNPSSAWNIPGRAGDPVPISETPYGRLFPHQMPHPEMWLARLDDAYYLPYAAPFLPARKILVNDTLVPWTPGVIGWFRYESNGTYRLPIDLTEAYTVDTAFFLGHPVSGHFGHFIGDCLSRMHAWRCCREMFGDVKILLDHSKQDTRFRNTFLAAMGVAPNDIVYAQGVVHSRRLLLASNALGVSRYASSTAAAIWQRLRDALSDPDKGQGERVYLSRLSQTARKLKNEAEVEETFSRHGFAVVRPEDCSLEEQVSVIANAQLVAGPAGSAMFNLAFHRQLKSVLMLFPETFVETTEWLLLAGANCSFYCHVGLRDMPAGSPSTVADEWRVDLPRLSADITNWLSRV